jgi:hypothetical protein
VLDIKSSIGTSFIVFIKKQPPFLGVVGLEMLSQVGLLLFIDGDDQQDPPFREEQLPQEQEQKAQMLLLLYYR